MQVYIFSNNIIICLLPMYTFLQNIIFDSQRVQWNCTKQDYWYEKCTLMLMYQTFKNILCNDNKLIIVFF